MGFGSIARSPVFFLARTAIASEVPRKSEKWAFERQKGVVLSTEGTKRIVFYDLITCYLSEPFVYGPECRPLQQLPSLHTCIEIRWTESGQFRAVANAYLTVRIKPSRRKEKQLSCDLFEAAFTCARGAA